MSLLTAGKCCVACTRRCVTALNFILIFLQVFISNLIFLHDIIVIHAVDFRLKINGPTCCIHPCESESLLDKIILRRTAATLANAFIFQ